MISYKYKLYRTKNTSHLDNMLSEACFVWNHALALQKRYYQLYGNYVSCAAMQKHFAMGAFPVLKCIRKNLIPSIGGDALGRNP